MNKEQTKWIWRDGEKSYVDFVKLPQQEKLEYIQQILKLDIKEISSTDEIILNRYGFTVDELVKNPVNKFLNINEDIKSEL